MNKKANFYKLTKILFMLILILKVTPFFINFCHAKEQAYNLAVAEFQAINVSAIETTAVSNFLRTGLVKAGLTVVDRNNMALILEEQRIQLSGCTDQICAIRIGKILNVEKVVIGDLTRLPDFYYITANVVDIATGQIILTDRIRYLSNRELADSADKLAQSLAEKITGKKAPSLLEEDRQKLEEERRKMREERQRVKHERRKLGRKMTARMKNIIFVNKSWKKDWESFGIEYARLGERNFLKFGFAYIYNQTPFEYKDAREKTVLISDTDIERMSYLGIYKEYGLDMPIVLGISIYENVFISIGLSLGVRDEYKFYKALEDDEGVMRYQAGDIIYEETSDSGMYVGYVAGLCVRLISQVYIGCFSHSKRGLCGEIGIAFK